MTRKEMMDYNYEERKNRPEKVKSYTHFVTKPNAHQKMIPSEGYEENNNLTAIGMISSTTRPNAHQKMIPYLKSMKKTTTRQRLA